MTTAKLTPFEPQQWLEFVKRIRSDFVEALTVIDRLGAEYLSSTTPNYDENRRWYHPETLAELNALWTAVQADTSTYRPVAEAAFSSILRFACSQNKHWGWICDNVWPKEHIFRPAKTLFFQKLDDFARSAGELREHPPVRENPAGLNSRIFLGMCGKILTDIDDESIDLCVTSPPYFGMTDYVRSQRLSFLWFEWDLDAHRSNESGARYKRRRLSAYTDYLTEMEDSFREISRVLKLGRVCAIVVGESPHRDSYLEQFEQIVEACGLRIEIRLTRAVSKRRVMSPQLHDERILIARKAKTP